MKIKRYADEETAKEIRELMRAAGGHCPCVLPSQRNDDTLCMCKNFREAPAGTICHCGLYIKTEN
jgi:hypothetical protein